MAAGVTGAVVQRAVAVAHKPAHAIVLHQPMAARRALVRRLKAAIRRHVLLMAVGVHGVHGAAAPQAVAAAHKVVVVPATTPHLLAVVLIVSAVAPNRKVAILSPAP